MVFGGTQYSMTKKRAACVWFFVTQCSWPVASQARVGVTDSVAWLRVCLETLQDVKEDNRV